MELEAQLGRPRYQGGRSIFERSDPALGYHTPPLTPVFVDLSGAWAQPGRVSAPDRVGDMRALGAVLYEMLTYQKPHGNPPVAPHLLRRGVLQDLSELALAMLETPEAPVH